MNMDARKTAANDAAKGKGIRLKAGSLLALWLAATAVIICAQIDRESRYRPGLADYVPSAFRSFSQAIIVKRLLNDGTDAAAAYAEAGRLLLRRPIPAENLSLYALAAARAGKEQQALQAIGLSAARGWHDQLSQYAALDAATQAGDWPSASLRLQALLQVQAQPAILSRAVQGFMTDPQGRTALAAAIAGHPPLQYQILAIAGANEARDKFPQLIAALKPYRNRMDCGSLRILVSRWLAHGIAGPAVETWAGLCGKGVPGRERDLSFSTRNGDANPFAWHIPDQSMLSWSVDSASGSLSYHNDENFGRLLGWRILTLAPGVLHLKMEGRPAVKNGNYPLLRLRCMPSGQPVKMESASNDHGMLTMLVPAGCNVQKLEIRIARGNFLGLRIVYP